MPCRPSATRILIVALVSASTLACDVDEAIGNALEDLRLASMSIAQMDSSGITGSGFGSYDEGDARASFSVSITSVVVGQQYNGHVHQGTCAAVGSAVQTLPVATGQAGTQGAAPSASANFEIQVAHIAPGYLIDFHTVISGVDRRVACGPMK
jgi:hypothetical protein